MNEEVLPCKIHNTRPWSIKGLDYYCSKCTEEAFEKAKKEALRKWNEANAKRP